MTESAAEVSVQIDATPAAIWRALTDPELIPEYFMGATATTDWQVGSPITWSGSWNGKPFEDKGEIIRADDAQNLTFSHWSPMAGTDDVPENYHVVAIELVPKDGGTTVTLTQSNLIGGITDADRASRADFEKNWSAVLGGLRQTVMKRQ